MGKEEKPDRKTFLISHEIKLAKALAANTKPVRDKALKSLNRWLANGMPLDEDDLQRLWHGLFYNIWMADKPLIQEETVDRICNMVKVASEETSFLFVKCGLKTLSEKWFGIDQLRMEKFLMLSRRLVRSALFAIRSQNWNKSSIHHFNRVLEETVLTSPPKSLGFTMHIIELFVEELAKVLNDEGQQHIKEFLIPFMKYLSVQSETRLTSHIVRHIFKQLINQTDAAIEYQQKLRAWKKMGFPGKSPHSLIKEEDPSDDEMDDSSDIEDEDNNNEEASNKVNDEILDPRAGKVDVEISQLIFDPEEIAQLLQEYKFVKGSNTKTRKAITKLVEQFRLLAKGIYPLGTLPEDANTASVISANDDKIEIKNNIEKTKGTKRKKTPLEIACINSCEVFRRNSGTWYVEKVDEENTSADLNSTDSSATNFNAKITDFNLSATDFNLSPRSFKSSSTSENLFNSTSTPNKKIINGQTIKSQDGSLKITKHQEGFSSPRKRIKILKNELIQRVDEENKLGKGSIVDKLNTQNKFDNQNETDVDKKLNNQHKQNVEKQSKVKKQSTLGKQNNLDKQTILDKQSNSDKQTNLNKQSNLDKQTSFDHQLILDKQSNFDNIFDKQINLDKQSTLDKQINLDKEIESKKRKKLDKIQGTKQKKLDKHKQEKLDKLTSTKQRKLDKLKTTGISNKLEKQNRILEKRVKLLGKKEKLLRKQNGTLNVHTDNSTNKTKQTKTNLEDYQKLVQLEKKGKKTKLLLEDIKKALNKDKSNSGKKVKINVQLNSSQEIDEHFAHIRKSPAIPYDSTKKPVKSLLKPFINTPINPFLGKKFKF